QRVPPLRVRMDERGADRRTGVDSRSEHSLLDRGQDESGYVSGAESMDAAGPVAGTVPTGGASGIAEGPAPDPLGSQGRPKIGEVTVGWRGRPGELWCRKPGVSPYGCEWFGSAAVPPDEAAGARPHGTDRALRPEAGMDSGRRAAGRGRWAD